MIKFVLVISLILIGAGLAVKAANHYELVQKLKNSEPDSNSIVLYLKIGRKFMDKPGDEKSDMDSAGLYIGKAAKISADLHLINYSYDCVVANACLAATLHDFEKANRLFTQAAKYFENSGSKSKAAGIWEMYGDWIWYIDAPHAEFRKNAYLNAYRITNDLKERQKAADILGKVADADLRSGNLELAETRLLAVIEEYKLLKYPRIYYGYYMLGEVLYRKNDIKRGLIAKIEAANSFDQDPKGNPNEGARYYFNLAGAYYNDLQYQNSLKAYVGCMELAKRARSKVYYYLAIRGAGLCYSKLHRYREGIEMIKKTENHFADKSANDEMGVLSAKLELYTQAADLVKAKEIIRPLRSFSSQVLNELGKETEFYKIDNYIAMSDPLISYYIRTKQWNEFESIFRQLDSLPKKGQSVLIKRRLLNYSYTRDSVSGNLMAALRSYKRITQINDSINNADATRHIQELEAKYRSLAKDKTIQSLHGEALTQKERLQRRSLQLYGSLVGSLLFLIIAGTAFYAYRNKKRANIALSRQQDQISEQNYRLSALLAEKESLIQEKDGLLVEKEWLLREVHHRVKNNLQIVMSLLYSQSAHLQNPEAINAIRNIQDQIQSIAIIHQKLYNKSGLTTISLSDYVQDLIGYLSGVYMPVLRMVKVTQKLETIDLGPGQAVPIGLIMNEAITNSIKYAFNEGGGEIKIQAFYSKPSWVKLIISDNGPGFKETDQNSPLSLGIEMMKALSLQINGTFKRENNSGALISVEFRISDSDLFSPGISFS